MKKLLSFFVLLFLVLPSFAVEVSTYTELRNAINSNKEEVLLSDDISFGSTSLTSNKNINLTTVNDSTYTLKGNTVAPMIEFRGANSTISNITFSSVTSSTSVNPAIFVNVGTVGSGQTYSTFTIRNVNFEYNTSNTNNGTGGALLINSKQGVYITNTAFSTNSALGTGAKGGAIYYEGDGDFVGHSLFFDDNMSQSDGGAVYASSMTLVSEEGNIGDIFVGNVFSSNTSIGGNGGALYVSSGTLGSTVFLGNNALAGNGGAIYASTLTIKGQETLISTMTGDFAWNFANDKGGAIYVKDYASIYAIFNQNISTGTVNGFGGAIYTESNAQVDLEAALLWNEANKGGAVYNEGKLKVHDTDFFQNVANSDGGALYTKGNTEIQNVSFQENVAGGKGGAIYVDNTTLELKGIIYFINNISSETGGAIYANNGTIKIDTLGNNVIFQGNTDSTGNNDIVLDGSSILKISGGGSIDFYGGVKGGSITSNNTVLNWYTQTAHNGSLIMDDSVLNLHSPDTTLGTVTLNNTVLNTQNGVVGTLTTNSLNITGDTRIYIDVDLANNTKDTFTNLNNTGNIIIESYNQLNILSDSSSNPTFNLGGTVSVNEDEDYYGPLYVYNLHSATGGGFQIVRTNRTNPLISSLPIAANAKVMSNMHTTTSLYNRIDVMFSRDRLNYRRAENPQDRFDGPQVDKENPIKQGNIPTQSKNHMAWFIPNVGYHKVDYGNDINDVRNILYGGVIGIDFPFLMSDETFLVPTFFVGYLGSKQEYQKATLNNDSLAVGGMLTFKNYFALLSAQMYITNGSESYTLKQYHGSFDIFSYTASVKGELDLDITDTLVFQPAFTLFYNISGLQNYNTVNGASIHSDKFHNVILSPSVKVMASLNGWYPYLSGSININALQKGEVIADDLVLPKYKIKDYTELSFGIENTFLKDYSGYVQVSAYTGGIRGVSFQMGLRGYLD